MQSMTVSQYITQQLITWGIKQVYGVAGDAIFPWLDELGKQDELTFIATRHESAAAMMASAAAKLTQLPAVCIATSGPGTVNLLNGLADAHMDQVPVVAITGQVDSKRLGSHYKQYLQQQEILAPISHYSAEVVNPDQIAEVLQRAFVSAWQRKGVAHVSICKDVLAKTTTLPLSTYLPKPAQYIQADRAEVKLGLERIRQSKKPLVLLGTGARKAASWVIPFAEQIQAGILLSLGAKGVVPDAHPQVLGGLGEGGSKAAMQALHEADTLFVLGATWFPRSFIPNHLSIVQIDMNPEAIHPAAKMLSIVANIEDVVPYWLKELKLSHPEPNREWMDRINQLHQDFWMETELYPSDPQATGIRPEQVIRLLQEAVEPDAIIAIDTGEHTLWFNRMFHADQQYPLFSGKWRTMGYGLPAGIAAKLVYPERQVVVLVGDGGIQMNLAELMTLRKYGAGVKVVIFNNRTLGLEVVKMKAEGLTPFGLELDNPDFAALAKACGLNSKRIENADELKETLQEVLQSPDSIILDVSCTNPTLTLRKQDFILQTNV